MMKFLIEDCIRFSFIPTLLYTVAILRSSHSPATIMWALWWCFVTIFSRVSVSHRTLYNRSPEWWDTWNARLLFSSTLTAILYACGVPYAWLGCFVLRASSFKTLSFFGFGLWVILCAASVVPWDWWPLLFIVLAVIKQWAEKERSDPVIYWARRSLVNALHQDIRWCLWCKAVFPHYVRSDVMILAWVLTTVFILHRWMVYIQPKKVFKFINLPKDHVPAPSIETALACAICKAHVQIDDEERMYDKNTPQKNSSASHKDPMTNIHTYTPQQNTYTAQPPPPSQPPPSQMNPHAAHFHPQQKVDPMVCDFI